jgi:hypothetical protein
VHFASPSDLKAAHMSRLMLAGLAVAGAGLLAMTPATNTGPQVQHRAVKLVDTEPIPEVDWTGFFQNVSTNLTTLQGEAATSSSDLSAALGNVSDAFSTQISTALTGFDTGINNALFGGWFGSDDGYVYGLFGGETITGGSKAVAEGLPPTSSGSLIDVLSNDFANISTNPNGSEQLFSDINVYELELLDHTLKPLLGPILDEGTTTSPVYSIPAELSQIQTNLINAFGTYNELKDLAQTVLSPEISTFYALTTDLDNVSGAFTAGDSTTALTDLNNLPSDVLNAFINGFDAGENPVNHVENLFPGLINTGSFLDELYTTFTQQFVDALGSLGAESGASVAAESVSTALPDLFTGLF